MPQFPISQTAQLVWDEPEGLWGEDRDTLHLYMAKHPPKGGSWGGQVLSATPVTVKAGSGLAKSWKTAGEGMNLNFCS